MSRAPGIPNKNKQRLLNAARAEYGDDFDPVMQMIKNASTMQLLTDGYVSALEETASVDQISKVTDALKDVIEAWNKVAVYITPKLKAIEHTGADGGPIDMHWTVNVCEVKEPYEVPA